jgi:hypothetical protein
MATKAHPESVDRRRPRRRQRSPGLTRRLLTIAMLLSAGAMSMGLFLISPVALMELNGGLSDGEATRMSNIGQAYGGISAFLSGGAAAGVAAALFYQSRQIKTSQAQGIRMMQVELMRMLIENPDLRPKSPTLPGVSGAQRSRIIFSNLMFRYLEMGFEIGYFPSDSLRYELKEQFKQPEIRQAWEKISPAWEDGVANRAQRQFLQLIQDAYRESRSAETQPADAPTDLRRRPSGIEPIAKRRYLAVFALGLATGLAARRALARTSTNGAGDTSQ